MSISHNQQFFRSAKFITSVFDCKDLPKLSIEATEIAMIGRSNCGKSSIINALANNKLAIVSKTPGRTRSINYYQINPLSYLVDLPGYGYAKVNLEIKVLWHKLLDEYLLYRSNLKGILLIMDLRHPLQPFDYQMLHFAHTNKIPTCMVLNKADQLSTQQIKHTVNKIMKALEDFGDDLMFEVTSAKNLLGIEELRKKIINWF